MMVFISNGKLHVSAYSDHLQVLTTSLLKVLHNMPKPRGDVEISSSFYALFERHIQGVPGGMCQTSGGCSLC